MTLTRLNLLQYLRNDSVPSLANCTFWVSTKNREHVNITCEESQVFLNGEGVSYNNAPKSNITIHNLSNSHYFYITKRKIALENWIKIFHVSSDAPILIPIYKIIRIICHQIVSTKMPMHVTFFAGNITNHFFQFKFARYVKPWLVLDLWLKCKIHIDQEPDEYPTLLKSLTCWGLWIIDCTSL